MSDLVLPAFELDCREWLVVSPAEAGLPDEAEGAPLLAVLSTVVIDDDIREASGALTVGLLDDRDGLDVQPIAPGSAAHRLMDDDGLPGARRYLMPSPRHDSLALVAEFLVAEEGAEELERRIDALMASFRWQAA